MHHALSLPITGEYSDPNLLAELAREAENAGWDGVFVRDMLLFNPEGMPAVTDPWMVLAAIAMRTRRVKIGPMVAPLAHRRPWKVARELVALDQLSGGRLILGVGLEQWEAGDTPQSGGDNAQTIPTSQLDEALEMIAGLCSGERFHYDGEHHHLKETIFLPPPVQEHIPIWIAGWWPKHIDMRRLVRWDGVYLAEVNAADSSLEVLPMSPDTARTFLTSINNERTNATPFDVTISRSLWHDEPATASTLIAEFAEAGVTWIIQDILPGEGSPDQVLALIRQGPPQG